MERGEAGREGVSHEKFISLQHQVFMAVYGISRQEQGSKRKVRPKVFQLLHDGSTKMALSREDEYIQMLLKG